MYIGPATYQGEFMKKNIHDIERMVRIVIGLFLVGLTFMSETPNYWFLLGVVPLTTGIIGWCPPYAMLGINTCKLQKAKK